MIQARKLSPALTDYSTTEKDTGCKWVDGKTIYKKTIKRTADVPAGNTDISIGVNIDTLVKFYGTMKNTSGTTFTLPFIRPNPASSMSDQIEVRIINHNTLRMTYGGEDGTFNNMEMSVTLYYTKTI